MNIYLGEAGNMVRTWRLAAVWIGSALGEEMTGLNRAGELKELQRLHVGLLVR